MTALRLYWSTHHSSRTFHTRSTCGVRRVGDKRESELAVIALPKLRAEGRHLCSACEKAS